MIYKILKSILFLIMVTNLSWCNNQGLNGILTFDEYNNFDKKRTGITSFKLVNGKESYGYKVATGSFPYRHKNGKVVYKQGCGLSVINKDGFTTSVAPCPPKERYHQSYYEYPQLSPSGLFVAVELKKSVYKNYNFEHIFHTLIFDIKGNKIATYPNYFAPTWLPDGRLLLSSERNHYGLFVTDKSLKKISQIDNKKLQEFAYYPDVSPSGKRVVFEYNQQIWIMDMNGTGLKRLLREAKRLRYPTWSPDGKYIAYLMVDSSGYYDEAIYLFEVDGENKKLILNTKKIFFSGKTGHPDITGPLSWVSSDFSAKTSLSNTKMPDIKKVGYSKKSFADLMELLSFTLGRKLTQKEKIEWVKSDYIYANNNFKNRQKKIKKVLEKFSAMNREIKTIKDKKHLKLVQKYMQEYFVMSYKKSPIEIGNGMVSKLFTEDVFLPIEIQEKKADIVPVEYNKNSVIKNSTGYTNINVTKIRESRWIQNFSKTLQLNNLQNAENLRESFSFIPHTKATGRIESWNNEYQSYIYYAKENPLSHFGEYIKLDKNHYKLKYSKLPITLQPWGYTFYDEIDSAQSIEKETPIYLMHTSDINKGYKYLLNCIVHFNLSFDLDRKNPSDFQREIMSHINRLRLELGGKKPSKINFDLWFDSKEYASTFIFLLKLKIIELRADYKHKSVDEWLLQQLKFKQEGKHVYINQQLSSKVTKEFIKRIKDEIKIFQK